MHLYALRITAAVRQARAEPAVHCCLLSTTVCKAFFEGFPQCPSLFLVRALHLFDWGSRIIFILLLPTLGPTERECSLCVCFIRPRVVVCASKKNMCSFFHLAPKCRSGFCYSEVGVKLNLTYPLNAAALINKYANV